MERTPLDEKRQRSASRFERVEGETAPTTSMRPSTKAPLLAPLARRRTQLIEKGVTRPRRKIAPRLPAGSTVLAGVPKGRDFMRTKKSGGGAVQKQRIPTATHKHAQTQT